MADPISIIGTAGALATIIDVLVKTVTVFRELHDQWKEADFTFINLIAQLTALRAALDKIQEWLNTDVAEPHHQLVMDLEVSISCCRMLVTKLQSHASELRHKTDNTLNFASKMRLIKDNGTLDELQKIIERQTIALTLLLTACNCKAISEQKKLLERSSSRKIFQKIRDDSSSLYVLRDDSSFRSRWTGTISNLSKISKIFDFDRELFISKPYEKALQKSLKDTVQNLRQEQRPEYRETQILNKQILNARR